jgi:Bifunctional DNA primase/polymerase, N-terminal/Primase C terminal 1 (PriCT-1)
MSSAENASLRARQQVGPFVAAALKLYSAGLCPIPCGGANGKIPLVRWETWKRRPSLETVSRWTASPRFSRANIGILTGLSVIVVVDCDDPSQLEQLIARFGHTLLVIATPSGGRHLWYRSSGERCANLRNEGFAADVKGLGGLVIVPPSTRGQGGNDLGQYRFLRGDWDDLPDLPAITPAGQASLKRRSVGGADGARLRVERRTRQVLDGERNNTLFRYAIRIARGCKAEVELIEELQVLNYQVCDPPLSEEETARVAHSAWGYEETGSNFSASGGFSCNYILIEVIGDAEAFWLFAWLRRFHQQNEQTRGLFAISARAMALAGSIPTMSEHSIRRARDLLVKAGVLIVEHQGGKGQGDPSLYRFARLDLLRPVSRDRSRLSASYTRGPDR